jgi:hypothetical protein
MAEGRARAAGAERSGEIWSHAIDQLGQITSGALQRYGEQKNQAQIGQAVMAATSPNYPSATKPGPPGSGVPIDPGSYSGPGPSSDGPDPGSNHMQAILNSVAPENRLKVMASIQATQESAAKAQSAIEDAKQKHMKVQQTVADTLGTFALGLEQHLGEPDGGIGLANSGLAALGAAGIPGVDKLAPVAAAAKQAYQAAVASGDPAQVKAVLDQWHQQVGPLIQQGKTGLSVDAQKAWADTQEKLKKASEQAVEKVEIRNADGSITTKLVEKKPGQTFQGAPPEPKDELEKYIRDKYGATPTAAQRLAGHAQWSAAGREPDVAMALSPQALDQAARLWVTTGTLPPAGMGKQGVAMRQAIMNRGAQLAPEANLADNKAGFGADAASVKKLQQQTDAVAAFERTASKNAALLDEILKKTPDSGVTLLNKPLRSISTVLGSEDMARFNTLRQSVQNEYARIISNPGLSGVMSDSARKEAETLLSPDATVGQIRAAISTLRAEAANRHASYQGQIAEIHKRIGGKQESTTAPADPLGIR